MKRLSPPVVITRRTDLNRLIQQWRSDPALAIDTESNSLYVYHEQVCLVQVSTRDTDYVVDPFAVRDLDPLAEIFANPAIQKVFHAAEYDLICLKRDYGFEVINIFDTMQAARILGWSQVGLAAILEARFQVQLDKRWQRADWGQRPLPLAALDYARMDTHYLLPLRDLMESELHAAGRIEEATEEFARLASVQPTTRLFDPEAFWRINGAQDLDATGLAVLRELYLYREDQARRVNRPPFKVIGDQTLMKLAQARPQHEFDLQTIDGLSFSQIRHYGAGLLSAIQQGLHALPPRPTRSERPDEEILARYDALHSWRKATAQKRGVESDIIIPRETLWTLARRAPRSREDMAQIEGLGPWRLQAYGDEILAVLGSATRR